MIKHIQSIAWWTITRNEVKRIARIWLQTLLPPIVTIGLYFIIFGQLIGSRIGPMAGYSYIDFIAPGLIMMSVITNAYANVVGSFYSARFQNSIEELLISPVSNLTIVLGYISGGVVRGLLVGCLAMFIASCFTDQSIASLPLTLFTIVLTASFFSLAGLLNGIFANSFDDTAIIPTFILAPLIYLGGIFYTIDLLPSFWQQTSAYNPIFYMVSLLRYSMLGIISIPIGPTCLWLVGSVLLLGWLNVWLLNRGVGIRN